MRQIIRLDMLQEVVVPTIYELQMDFPYRYNSPGRANSMSFFR